MTVIPTEIIDMIVQVIMILIAIYAALKKAQVDVLTTPKTTSVTLQKIIVPTLPDRSWKMSDATKRYITKECPPAVQLDILAQVEAAEAEKKVDYWITFPGGGYRVQYGIQCAAKGNCNDCE